MSEAVTKELPDEWVTVPLTDLLIEFETGTRPKGGVGKYTEGVPSIGAEHLNADGGFKFEKIKFVPEEFASSMKRGHLQEGDILVVKDGATTAKASLVRKSFPHDGAVINEHVFRCKVNESIESAYIFYYLFSGKGQKEILSDFRGAAQGGISKGFTDKVNIPLAPPEQQKRIVAKIEELFSHIDAGIEALKKAKKLLKQYRQSVLKAAVTGELTKEWRVQNNVTLDSWQQTTIGEIALVQTGKTPKRSNPDYWEGGTIPWLTSSATNEPFTHKADQFVTQAAVGEGLKLFKPGTLLMAMYGEGKTRGQVTEITFQATCNQACAAIIVDESKATRAFVRLRLYENYEETRKAASGGNQPNLNLSKVRDITLPLPTLMEQDEIVTSVEQKFGAIERVENDIEAQLLKSEINKQSILSSAFSGAFLIS